MPLPDGPLANVNGRGCNETGEGQPHNVAKEQYCDPSQYFSGPHAACLANVRNSYAEDMRAFGFDGVPDVERGGAGRPQGSSGAEAAPQR